MIALWIFVLVVAVTIGVLIIVWSRARRDFKPRTTWTDTDMTVDWSSSRRRSGSAVVYDNPWDAGGDSDPGGDWGGDSGGGDSGGGADGGGGAD